MRFERVVYKAIESKGHLNFIAKLIILYYFSTPFLYLFRTLSGDAGFGYFVLRISEPILLFSTLFVLVLQSKPKLNAYSLSFLFIGVYGFLVALLQKNHLIDIVAGYFHFMTGILLFIYFYNASQTVALDKFMRIFSIATMMSCSFVIGFMYCMPYVLGFHIYLGLACQALIMVFFYNFQKHRPVLWISSLLLIIFSGKRGVLVALVIGFIISCVFLLHKVNVKTILKSLMGGLILAAFFIVVLPSTSEQLISKYTYEDRGSVDEYSAGRLNEVISAYNTWAFDIEKVIIGSGFGFTYTYTHSQADQPDVEEYKNVHFSYINPVIIFGVPVSLIYFVALGLLLIRMLSSVAVEYSYLKWSCITYLIYASFVFNLFDEPIFWMINGILLGQSQRLNQRSQQEFPCESY